MSVNGLTALPVSVERRGAELYLEVTESVDIGDFGTVGWADPVDPELVLVGENLFLRAGRFGAFATDATLEQVAQVIRRAYREFVEAARD
ncbi:hypothetical protein J4N02_00750 [Propioniciclava sp. MC1595]|uniref:hypothetical protein n=1 Tax=Propioniciclava sp. MC1595 TaxID=2760308 RepID=UPI0016627CD4|nr:hypothetical protein [Propioniciclava sp. MC1595]MBB1495101.1 hypothetical protein [Propioniciclava sp. MC1595]QTE26204.1 hypothetical protein J4N02_00750 [Propioniciclava sp. MC1595]